MSLPPPHLFDYSLNPTDSIRPQYKEHMNTGLNSHPTDPDTLPEEPDNIMDGADTEVECGVDDELLTFGKYRGMTPHQVSKTDPGWILWAFKTVTNRVTCSQELADKCAESVRQLPRTR